MNATRMNRRSSASRHSWRRPQVFIHSMVIILLLLSLAPIYLTVVISFKNPLQFAHQRWVPTFPLRLGNYVAAWEVVQLYIWNTFLVSMAGVLGVLVLSLIGGHVFARMRFPGRESLYYAIISLLMVPWVLTFVPSYMVYYQLGLINTRWALIIPEIASGQVFGIFLMRAVVAGIPEELYEAARCDGAGVVREITGITLPLSLPSLATLAVVNFISAWNSFIWPLVAVSDKSKQIVSVGLYHLTSGEMGRGFLVWGPLFAGYVVASIPLVVLFALLGRLYVEGIMGSGLKV